MSRTFADPMKISSFRPLIPNKKWISSPDSFSEKAKVSLMEYIQNGFYLELEPGFIIIEIKHRNYRYLGLVGMLSLDDYRNGKLLPHENVMAAQQQVNMDLLLHRKTMIKPCIIAYKPQKAMTQIMLECIANHKPQLELQFDNRSEKRTYWLIKEGSDEFASLQQSFKKVEKAFIADGHHRFAAATWLADHNNFPPDILCCLLSFDDMAIYDYDRIVEKPPNLTNTNLIAALSKYVNITPLEKPAKPRRKYEMIMKLESEWYLLKWRGRVINKLKKKYPILFDAQMLNEFVLRRIFGIENVKTDSRVTYFSGIQDIQELMKRRDEGKVAFILYPIKIDDLTKTVVQGNLLPPKSTWFEPRMNAGIIINTWDN